MTIPMPEPVAYPSDDWVEEFFGKPDECGFYVFRGDFGNIADRFRIAAKFAGLLTTAQAEAYKDACVREALEKAESIVRSNADACASLAVRVMLHSNADAIHSLIPPLPGPVEP